MDRVVEKSALIDGPYRYSLTRRWGGAAPLLWIMLNPSTADAEQDDATIRRLYRFSDEAGFGALEVGNLFAWRATFPTELDAAPDAVGPRNDEILKEMIARAPQVVCAWGSMGGKHRRDNTVLAWIRMAGKVPHALRLSTTSFFPCHPLYMPAKLRPRRIDDLKQEMLAA